MEATSPLVRPFAVLRPFARAGTAIALVLVMVISGGSLAFVTGGAGAASPSGGLAAAAVPTGVVQTGPQLQNDSYMENPGTPVSSLNNSTVLGNTSPNQQVTFTVGFEMRNAQALATIISEEETAGSGMYHQWLTLQQEETLFGPSPTTVQDTENYFESLGFQVGTRGPISISFIGSAAQVDKAFKSQMVNVQFGNGSTGYVNDLPLALPTPIATEVATVNGLDSAVVMQPTDMVNDQLLGQADEGIPTADQPAFNSAFTNATTGNVSAMYNYTNHAFVWFKYYSTTHHQFRTYQVVTPAALSTMYQAMPLIDQGINGNSTGTPISIAIVMAGGINPGDLRGFSQMVWNNPNQIIDRVKPVPVDRTFGLNGTVTWTDGGSGEMALDIEYSSTMAPGARIIPVYGPTLADNILDDDYAAIASMTTAPNIISNSYGGGEDREPNLYGPNWANSITLHDYFMLLTGRGSTILVSSADGGGFDPTSGVLSGSFPATDPYTLSVDGIRSIALTADGSQFPANNSYGQFQTQLPIFGLPNETIHVDQTSSLGPQEFWYTPNTNITLYAPPYASGGFGTSYWFTQPWFQHGVGVPNVGRALGSGVAAEADFNETIFFDGVIEWGYGGTSFACPTTAGEFALIDDYLRDNGQSPYLGLGDYPVFRVANAWYNGNISLVPYADVTNGTSYWGNIGAQDQYAWPPGQDFPNVTVDGKVISTYGDTLPGFDFPTGWGSINVYNFARDLLQIEQMPGSFITVNATTNKYAPVEWSNLSMNNTYTFHVNASGTFASSNPVVSVKFVGDNGVTNISQPVMTPIFSPATGYDFTVNTSGHPFAPFFSPGLLILTIGNATDPSAGFAYDWVAPQLPTGPLNVTVVTPGGGGEVGGYSEFNGFLGYGPPTVEPACCGALFPNTFTVRVTQNGHPVYDAQVSAQVASTSSIAFEGTLAEAVTNSYGNPHYLSPTIISQTFTNLTGDALVYTWNVIAPTTFFVNATYGVSTGGTTYQVLPGPNVGITDASGGTMSNFNIIRWILFATHQNDSDANIARYEANALNQTALWNLMYGWQGERLAVNVNNYSGAPISGANVWLGTFDSGRETKFEHYQGTGGTLGVTNSSGTANVSGPGGIAYIQIPDNMSDQGFFSRTAEGQTSGWGFVAVDVPGSVNRTFQYTEPCAPDTPTFTALITCEYNNSYQRNYTAAPILVLPNPVNLTMETPNQLPLSFFGVGANVSFEVNVTLPFEDPTAGGNFGWNWPSSLEHVDTIKAYVDGQFALDLSPDTPPFWQNLTEFGNLSNDYAPGEHNLTLVVTDSQGHVFTETDKFIVGGVTITNLASDNLYTIVPYVVNWTLDIPASEVYNYTFNQSFDLRYVSDGCGGLRNPCPTVVNLTEKIRDGQVNYNQSINLTLMGLEGFYSGYGASGGYPPGQYEVIIWLTANNTGSIAKQVNTYLIFSQVTASINGPGKNATVPLGNVTIAYNYSGGYINNATLNVYLSTAMDSPVFTAGAYVPAVGEQPRGGSATWEAVETGQYEIVLTLGTPYASFTAHNWINVSNLNGLVYLNQSLGPKPLISLSAPQLGAVLAIIGLVIGLFLGLIAAPAFRPANRGSASGRPSSGAKPWDEGKDDSSAGLGAATAAGVGAGTPGGLSCPICHEPATNEFSLHQHQQVVHGLEE
jgi:subtilase family serine protease